MVDFFLFESEIKKFEYTWPNLHKYQCKKKWAKHFRYNFRYKFKT